MARSESLLMERARSQLPPPSIQVNSRQPLPTSFVLHIPRSLPKQIQPQGQEQELHPEHLSSKRPSSFRTDTNLDMETYNGHVRTPADAIILFEACRLGLLPRVQRRLSEKERQSIKSGSVFVWDEREAGMRRWTDGKSWSASRVSGSFLTYREMEGKRGGGGNGYPPPVTALSRQGRTPDSTHGSESDLELGGEEGPDGYRYKPDGLVKQSFSITTSSGNHLHLISYYSRSHPSSQQLNSPSNDPQLRHIRPAKGMYPESTVHEHQNIPAVTRSPMGGAPYTTTPQMAGYARQGPPHWPQQQSYGWSQSPANPQQQYYPYQYASSPHPNSQPSSTSGNSPLQYPHYPTSQPADRNYPPYDNRPPQPQPDYQGYDARRYPPSTPENRPPPPVPQPHYSNSTDGRPPPPQQYSYTHSPYSSTPREGYPPAQYDSQRYPARPPPSSESSAPPSHAQPYHGQPSNSAQHPAPSSQPWTPGALPLPQPTQSTSPMQRQSSQQRATTPIDPQLMISSSLSPQQRHPSRTPSPNMLQPSKSGLTPPQPNGYGATTASSIPSINAIMNGAGTGEIQSNGNDVNKSPGITTNGHTTNGYTNYTQNPKKSPSQSSSKGKDGPQDIPSDKVGFGEDVRTVKVLNRAFKT